MISRSPRTRWLLPGLLASISMISAPAWATDREDERDDQEKQETPFDIAESVKKIQDLMTQVEDLLAELNTGKRTQADQRKIIEELDKVIDEISQIPPRGGQGQGQQQRQPRSQQQDKKPSDSEKELEPRRGSLTPPPGGGDSRNDRREERREPTQPRSDPIRKILADEALRWGSLPPRQRDQVLDQKAEEVPDRFRADVERYWKRLAGTGHD